MRRFTIAVTIAAVWLSACGSDSTADTANTTADTAAAGTTAPDTDTTAQPPATEAPETTPAPTEAPTTTVAPVGPAALDASPYLMTFGDLSLVSIPDGEANVVSVVANAGTIDDSGSVVIIVRNNTSETIGDIDVSATARDEAGALAGSGSSQGLEPAVVAPGEIAFGYVYFDSELAGTSPTYEFTVDAQEYDNTFGSRPVTVTELNATDERILGLVLNEGDEEVSGPIGVKVICFDATGAIIGTEMSYTDQDTVAPGKTASFAIDLYGNACPAGIVGASGYSF